MTGERFIGCHTIHGVEGEHPTPFMTRAWIGRLRLHIFHRGDADSDPHDHPWDFWTFPLTSYVEEVTEIRRDAVVPGVHAQPRYFTFVRVVPAFRLHHRPATFLHRVIGRHNGEYLHDWPGRGRGELPVPIAGPGRIVTIVWRGRSVRRWGFLKHRDGRWCWVHWREYVFGGGKHAPCEPGDGS